MSETQTTAEPTGGRGWAWLGGRDGFMHRHDGGFRAEEERAADGVSWYVNDFALSDARPWRVPVGGSGEAGVAARPVVAWKAAERGPFDRAFGRIMEGIRAERLVKAVPVSTAEGECAGGVGAWARYCLGLDDGGAGGYAFGWEQEGSGFGGFSPEILFQVEGRRLTTMALAGTVDAAHAGDLEAQPKLGREHAVVVDALRHRLEPLGRVMVGRREVVAQGTIRHLRTRLSVQLDEEPDAAALNRLVRLVHPTPALGISPSRKDTLEELQMVRDEAGAPRYFGAPFGVAWPGGALFVVAIRGLFWNADKVWLPAGCGLVAGSEADAEWEEVELKRAWVRRVFALD